MIFKSPFLREIFSVNTMWNTIYYRFERDRFEQKTDPLSRLYLYLNRSEWIPGKGVDFEFGTHYDVLNLPSG